VNSSLDKRRFSWDHTRKSRRVSPRRFFSVWLFGTCPIILFAICRSERRVWRWRFRRRFAGCLCGRLFCQFPRDGCLVWQSLQVWRVPRAGRERPAVTRVARKLWRLFCQKAQKAKKAVMGNRAGKENEFAVFWRLLSECRSGRRRLASVPLAGAIRGLFPAEPSSTAFTANECIHRDTCALGVHPGRVSAAAMAEVAPADKADKTTNRGPGRDTRMISRAMGRTRTKARAACPVSGLTPWLLTTGYQLPATGYRLPATGYRLPATGHRLPATGYRLPPTGYRLLTTFSSKEQAK
jgi:hypothetical protein